VCARTSVVDLGVTRQVIVPSSPSTQKLHLPGTDSGARVFLMVVHADINLVENPANVSFFPQFLCRKTLCPMVSAHFQCFMLLP